jgi:hypothetical protein
LEDIFWTIELAHNEDNKLLITVIPPVFHFEVYYNAAENSDIESTDDRTTARIDLTIGTMLSFSSAFGFHMSTSLCNETTVTDESNQYTCAGDGTHHYEYTFVLPDVGFYGWFSSGRGGSGVVQLLAQHKNERIKIGECYFFLKTLASKRTPTVSICLAAAAVLGLLKISAVLISLLQSTKRQEFISSRSSLTLNKRVRADCQQGS